MTKQEKKELATTLTVLADCVYGQKGFIYIYNEITSQFDVFGEGTKYVIDDKGAFHDLKVYTTQLQNMKNGDF